MAGTVAEQAVGAKRWAAEFGRVAAAAAAKSDAAAAGSAAGTGSRAARSATIAESYKSPDSS